MDMLFIIVNAREDDKALMAIEAANRATREMKVHNGYEEEA